MNFFEHQDQARRNTAQLVVLFVLAIVVMIATLNLAALLILHPAVNGQMRWWQPELFSLISLATLMVIGTGSLTKMAQLRQGGSVVAQDLGGRPIPPQTEDFKEQQLLNVVSEMALAAGIPVPAVYLLTQEPGINAFAAGHSPDNAVIGVTQGCLDQLNRDQLQGVIAHEFSHILNGDMRLNLRLIGVLHGLLFIYILGRILLRLSGYGGASRRSQDKGGAPIVAAGLAMVVIGGIGLVFGRMIKSAVSRQREFLADASAVQFTRNPDGLAGALRCIGRLTTGSTIRVPEAEAVSHMFFGTAMGPSLMGDWFATHPPLPERIRRITGLTITDPVSPILTARAGDQHILSLQGQPVASASASFKDQTRGQTGNQAKDFVASIGTTSSHQLARAHAFLQTLPPSLTMATKSSPGAMATVYALLLDTRPAVRSHQLAALQANAGPVDPAQVEQLVQVIQTLDSRQHLPLLDLMVPALRTMSPEHYAEFCAQITTLIQADGRLSLSEYVLQIILQKRLRPHFQPQLDQPQAIANLESVWPELQVVLTVLARIGQNSPADALYTLKSGLSRLPGARQRELPRDLPRVNLLQLSQSLKRLEALVPKLKQDVVDAAAHMVLVDHDVTLQEAELLRAIVITLDCPTPPFLEPATASTPVKPARNRQ